MYRARDDDYEKYEINGESELKIIPIENNQFLISDKKETKYLKVYRYTVNAFGQTRTLTFWEESTEIGDDSKFKIKRKIHNIDNQEYNYIEKPLRYELKSSFLLKLRADNYHISDVTKMSDKFYGRNLHSLEYIVKDIFPKK